MSEEYHHAMLEATRDKIGGSALEQKRYFAEVIGPYPLQFWLDGCAAPCVNGAII